MMNSKILIFISGFLLITISVFAKINFQSTEQDRLDLDELTITKTQFFNFLKTTILTREPGLGSYGRVSFSICDIEIEGLKIIDYKTKDGKEIKFLNSPSCQQIALTKLLENNYQYNSSAISFYQNRQCILNVERIISPILEYYTLKYEERSKGNCSTCSFKEKERLDLIVSIQKKILQHCQIENKKVMNFITDLDSQIEQNYKVKSSN